MQFMFGKTSLALVIIFLAIIISYYNCCHSLASVFVTNTCVYIHILTFVTGLHSALCNSLRLLLVNILNCEKIC